MGVILQAFIGTVPYAENCEHQWWSLVKSKLADDRASWFHCALASAGEQGGRTGNPWATILTITMTSAISIKKAVCPRGSVPRSELLDLIRSAHEHGLQVYADLVFNHNSGADSQELNPIDEPISAGRSSRRRAAGSRATGAASIRAVTRHGMAARSVICRTCVIALLQSIPNSLVMPAGSLEEIGFDGFPLSTWLRVMAAGWFVRSRNCARCATASASNLIAVGECWDSERTIGDWLDEVNAWSDNRVGAFDFPLRWRLRDLCDSYGFSLRNTH